MNRACALMTGVSFGAAAMYFFDPVVGNRRRALLRDQFVHLLNKTGDVADARYRDLQNRAYGAVAEVRGAVRGSSKDVSDELLVNRVRSQLGRHVSHPRAIEVSAHNGVVTLSGPILAGEVEGLVCAVGCIRGATNVDDQLEVHKSAAGIAALQGGAKS